MMNPAFNFGILKTRMASFNKGAFQLAQKLETVAEKPVDDVLEYLKQCSFQVMADFVLGLKLDNERHLTIVENFLKLVDTVSEEFITRLIRPWLYADSLLPLFPSGRKFLKVIEEIDNVLKEILNELIANRQKTDSQGINSCGKMILNLYLQDQTFTERDVRDHLFNFTSAGYDTVYNTMQWCLYALASHPEVQEKAYCEVESVVPDGDITFDHLAELKYLECVIKETLRLYPTVPVIGRRVQKDIKCGKYTLPKGTEVCFFIFMLHRDPNVFPEPEKFDPERFIDNSAIRSWLYMPFAEGYRNCIGKKFAMMEIKVQLVYILRRFRITTEDKIDENNLDWSIVLKPDKNIRFTFMKRHSED